MENSNRRDFNGSFQELRFSWTVSVLSTSDLADHTGSNELRLSYWRIAGLARGVIIAIAATLGLGFNAFIVFAVLVNRKLRGKVVNVLHCHLAAVDIVWCALLIPVPAVSRIFGFWDGLCDAYALGRTLVTHATVWTIATLSWDKYRTIASPMRHSPTAELLPVSACLGTIWIAGLLTGAFPFLLCAAGSSPEGGTPLKNSYPVSNASEQYDGSCSGFFYDTRTGSCSASLDQTGVAWYSFFLSVETFCLPLVFLVYCYCHIFRIARWQKKRIAVMTAMVRVITLSVGVPITHENACRTSNQVTARGRKALRTVCVFLGAFLFCYAPYGLTSLAGSLYGDRLHPVPVAVADMLLMTSPTVNAFVYGIRNRMLKQSFRNCARRKCAQYALKFPGLQDTLRRRFGSSPEPMRGSASAPVVRAPAQVLEPQDRLNEKPNCRQFLKDEDIYTEKTDSGNSELVLRDDLANSEVHNTSRTYERRARNHELTRSPNGFFIPQKATSRCAVSDEDFDTKGGLGVAWKCESSSKFGIKGKDQMVIGVDVHADRKTPELTSSP